jgi:MvdD pre-ATP grasp domain
MTVLVLAQELDRTADGVIQGLTDLGEQVMRVDLSWFPQRLTLDAQFRNGSWRGYLSTEDHAVDLASIRAIWVRSPSLFRMPPGMSAVEADYARREAKIGVAGVLLALPGVLWVNRPDLAATAAYKPVQYALAARCGLPVPRTLISNSASAVSRFARSSRTGVVCKPLTTNLWVVGNNVNGVGLAWFFGPTHPIQIAGVTSRPRRNSRLPQRSLHLLVVL